MVQVTRRQALAAVAGVAGLGLAGCGSSSKKSDNLSSNRDGAMSNYGAGTQFKATKPTSWSIMELSNPAYPYKASWLFWSELTKRTNVTLQPVVVPLSDYNQKRSVMVSSGNAPLIIPKTYHPDETQYVAGGAVIPVSDYLDLMPNYTDKVAKWNLGANLDTFRQSDGKYYLLPGLHEQPWQDYTFAVRTDVLQQLGLSTPNTLDDFRQMLKAMKTAYPKSYPLSDRWNQPWAGGNLLSVMALAFGTYGGWNWQFAHWSPAKNTFEFTGAMDEYRQMVQYLNTLFTDGVLDPETFTQTDDRARQKLANGDSFVISTNFTTLASDYRPDIAKINPKATLAKIPLPVGPAGPVIDSQTLLENGVMISKKARDGKDFVALMQFIDWLYYSDEGEVFAKWGVKGTTYDVDASGNWVCAPDVNYYGLNPKGTKDMRKDFGFGNGVFSYGGSTKLLQSQFVPEELAFQKVMNTRKRIPVPPPAPLTDTEREQATLWEAPLKDYVFQQTLKFVLGQRPLSQWDAYVSELKGKNMTQYMDMVNNAHERYKKNHG